MDSDGNPNVLGINRDDGDSWVRAYYDDPGNQWYGEGAFPFLAS